MSGKSALNLLADYGGDSSDDEVPGCRVSTKRMHKEDDESLEPGQQSFKKRLPVPSFFSNDSNNDEDEAPSSELQHYGRIRSFKHERGNWATYVYIPYEFNPLINRLVTKIQDLVSNCDNINLHPCDCLHLSLTKTIVLRHHWIESFISSLKSRISTFRKFIIMFSGLNIYTNEKKTRTFISLDIKTGFDTLVSLVHTLDQCLDEFKLEKFYPNPSFHVSIMWCLGDQSKVLRAMLPDLNQFLHANFLNFGETEEFCTDQNYICVESIFCRTGNKLFQFALQ